MRDIHEVVYKNNENVKSMYCRNYSNAAKAGAAVEKELNHISGLVFIVFEMRHGRHKGRFVPVLTAAVDLQDLINASWKGFHTCC